MKQPILAHKSVALAYPVWSQLQQEGRALTRAEPTLERHIRHLVLEPASLPDAIGRLVFEIVNSPHLEPGQLKSEIVIILSKPAIQAAIARDIVAVKERDPATSQLISVLNFKGFIAIQAHRVAHELWQSRQFAMAEYFQSTVSRKLGIDIHPAAQLGSGLVFDHGTGIVIGETAVVGDDVTLFHNVTLGGTGKDRGDRHPKVGTGVVIGTGATLLGNITIGEYAKIGASSVVLKPVPAYATVVGNPARLVDGFATNHQRRENQSTQTEG